MERGPVVETPRLVLVACDLELAEALVSDREEAQRLLGACLHDEWPGEDTSAFLPYQVHLLRSDPERYAWGVWLMLKKDPARPLVIGDLGFKGPPNAEGAVDLGYEVVPEMRRMGYTFEAANALVDWAFSHPEVTAITADCYSGNQGSIRILEKLGMTRLGERQGLIKWSLSRSRRTSRCM